jgi:hypothetical protein
MNPNQIPEYEKLSSGKTIVRRFDENDKSLLDETHSYGILEIAIKCSFSKGVKTDELYFTKRRMVSRRTYEKARIDYADMPPADGTIEDLGSLLLRGARKQQLQNKAEAERRLAESAESYFPRPASTNWLRVISGEKSHLVVFASRDWKVLSRESSIPMGRHWLRSFGFHGTPGSGGIAKGLEVGFEVTGDRLTMLNDSKSLLSEVTAFVNNPTEPSQWQGSIRPRRKPRKHILAWPSVLPPLIEFLSGLQEPKVTIYNHHR